MSEPKIYTCNCKTPVYQAAPEMREELNNICLMCQRGEIEVEYTSLRLNGDCENCRIGKILKKVG